MEGQNYLGIYLGKDGATVVCLGSQGRGRDVLGCFSVSLEQQRERNISADMSELARLITKGCAERELEFSEVAVALDCSMFMQHNVHSEFKDTKQIAQTIRFDAEEALSTDISDVAIAFEVTSRGETGSELTVFTAQRQLLSDLLASLQSNNIDPVTVEPDVNCLSRFVLQNVSLPEDSHPLFAMLSRRSGYFISFAKSQQAATVRTFLVGRTQDKGDLLARQIPAAIALSGTAEPINCLKVFDSTDSVNCQQLSNKLGIEAGSLDLAQCAAVGRDVLADCADTVEFAIACGAALAHLEKTRSTSFRDDFMPYQGKKMRLQKTLKFLSVSVCVLMIALGMYVTSQLLQQNRYHRRLRDKFESEYSAVMAGQRLPGGIKPGVKKLGSVSRRLKSEKGPIVDDEALSAKLRLVLEAFNKCSAPTKLDIDTITITAKNIRIKGSTSGRGSTRRLRTAISGVGLKILTDNIGAKGKRDTFTITVVPAK